MPDNASRRGATDMGMPLMILAFIVIGGFLYWISGQAAEERELRMVEEARAAEEAAERADDGIQNVLPEQIQSDASPYEGQEIRLTDVEIASLLGTQGFWLEMPGGNPFLVSLSAGVPGADEVEPGMNAMVVGSVVAMNDSTLNAWVEEGSIGEGDRVVAEFATHYIEAARVQVSGGGEGQGN